MRIGIHTTIISLGMCGHFTHTRNLVEHLLSIDRTNEYIFFYNYFRKPKKEFFFDNQQSNARRRFYPFPSRLLGFLWSKYDFLPIEALLGEIDIFHSMAFHLSHPDFYLPSHRRSKLIVTIHDLIPLRFPQYYTPKYVDNCRRGLELVSKKADLVITDSESSKKDIEEISNLEAVRIKVIYNGVSKEFQPKKDERERVEKVKIKYGINRPYILFVGGGSPTKNISRLIEAFAIFKRNANFIHQLILTGVTEDKYAHLYKDIFVLGYMAQEDLPYIYNGAELFVFPSLYEGFGLPPLEAMACGAPVITSNISSLPEVVGDTAILVDPYNVEEIAEAIKKVLSDEELQQKMRQKGLERAKLFSWEKTAKETIKVYEELGESK